MFIYILYRVLQFATLPLFLLYVLGRGLRDVRYFTHLGDRFGFLPDSYKRTVAGAVWLHAVSVGEVLSSVELLRRLRASLPEAPLFVSCSTIAGRAGAEDKLKGLVDGIFYAPYDLVFAVRATLRSIRPTVVAVMETEIWPNLYREVSRSGAGLIIINGRISDRAFPGYRRFAWFFRRVLSWPDAVLVQSERDRERYLEIGAPASSVRVGGNLKYDFDPRRSGLADDLRVFLEKVAPEKTWIAASTMPPRGSGDVDEDDVVIGAFAELAHSHPSLLLILAPRKPERFAAVAAKLEAKGIHFIRRTMLQNRRSFQLPGVLLLDSIGELGGLFPAADVVFMGGTLAERGGHNILEPAFSSRAIIAGPHMENFAAIAEKFRAGDALYTIGSSGELARAAGFLLNDEGRRAELGGRAVALAEAERGATGIAVSTILDLYARAIPSRVPGLASSLFLKPLARGWAVGSALARHKSLAHRRRLQTPVVSVGGISMGGTGKTPFVLWLAGRMKEAGFRPAILTRGYRRKCPDEPVVVEPGAAAAAALTGDEAQILCRSAVAYVGIGSRRFEVGRIIEQKFQPGLFILDDGFQHWRLERQLDIVLVDALDPFAGGDLFPAGRLRESPSALGRAGVIVLTRTTPWRTYEGIETELRRFNAHAPIYHARTRPLEWRDAETGETWAPGSLPFRIAGAFCGLGNPASFWRTLDTLGHRTAFQFTFRDHHQYRIGELQKMAARAKETGAGVLLTTEKDFINLPDNAAALVKPARICWLKVQTEIEEEDALLEVVMQKVRR
ncbi:MAG: tetraacyldisaccharide 4'-kinase [Bryobacteraceae bacterium]|nr:tetraacyldisaccharide 4'-kinase [Bryobacterales bacterium]NUN03485.1 tetraacyldisaccharide 4'-kinase [Bryobacteraceae bacterium]